MFEPIDQGNVYRQEYIDSLEGALEALRDRAEAERTAYFRQHFPDNAGPIREKLRQKLGWPLNGEKRKIKSVRQEFVQKREGISVYRLQMELIFGIRFYGMLFALKDGARRPLIVAQHGGLGTPEVVGGLLESGTDNYHHLVERLNCLGANVFAPQMLIWDPKRFRARDIDAQGDVNEMRRPLDTMLQQVGSSLSAIELHALFCALDHLGDEPFVQPGRIGMLGLSYGGFYAMYASALDERIRACLTSCSFNERGRGRRVATDYVWGDSGKYFLDAEVALLTYPRFLRIQVARHDQILPFAGAEREYRRFEEMARALTHDDSWYLFDPFEGHHEFCPDDECLRWLIDHC